MTARGLGTRRDDLPWRCQVHGRLNDPRRPEYPGCGCESPLEAARFKDDAELRACRAMKGQEDPRVTARKVCPSRERQFDYHALAWAPGSCSQVAKQFGCSHTLVYRARRLTA